MFVHVAQRHSVHNPVSGLVVFWGQMLRQAHLQPRQCPGAVIIFADVMTHIHHEGVRVVQLQLRIVKWGHPLRHKILGHQAIVVLCCCSLQLLDGPPLFAPLPEWWKSPVREDFVRVPRLPVRRAFVGRETECRGHARVKALILIPRICEHPVRTVEVLRERLFVVIVAIDREKQLLHQTSAHLELVVPPESPPGTSEDVHEAFAQLLGIPQVGLPHSWYFFRCTQSFVLLGTQPWPAVLLVVFNSPV
mmetsp:Transcript_104865/g.249654  ORF Transcript_104865/g.249654 Transcript_104865/m.249654 type:complete len:248 (-) Transcript_104865:485-1228(-)